MITPITKSLSEPISDSIETDTIIYAEVTSTGAMGNSGGIVVFIRHGNGNEMLCYETSIYQDEETYLMAEESLFKHSE